MLESSQGKRENSGWRGRQQYHTEVRHSTFQSTKCQLDRLGMHSLTSNNNKLGRKLADQSGDEREISFLFQRLSVLIQRYNAILPYDCFVNEKEE